MRVRFSTIASFEALGCCILLLALPLSGCSGDAPEGPVADSDAGVDRDAGTDAGTVGPQTCSTHSDCACPAGICISTGLCWCPPCETDADCAPGKVCRSGNCIDFDPTCEGPLRLSPDRGRSTGGTLVTVEGQGFWVGALEWWGKIGDGPILRPITGSNCSLSFLTGPMPAGTYPVHVFYGWPGPGDPAPPNSRVGDFTFEAYDGVLGGSSCTGSVQCDPLFETCDLGIMRCLPDICRGLVCGAGESCDSIEGCIPFAPCETNADCKLLMSGCACQAAPASDPREAISTCQLDGCDLCRFNTCGYENIWPACLQGRCTERFGDSSGISCETLVASRLASTLEGPGWIREPQATRVASEAFLTWMEPVGTTPVRYGVIRTARIDSAGNLLGTFATLDGPGGMDSHPSITSLQSLVAVTWTTETPAPVLFLQRLDLQGQPLGSPRQVADQADESIASVLLVGAEGGFDLFWMQQDWRANDGFYHQALSVAGDREGSVDHVPWILGSNDSFAVVGNNERFALSPFTIAWPSALGELPGLYLSPFPLTPEPIQLLAEEGSEIDLLTTGRSLAAVWRSTQQTSTRFTSSVFFQTFDLSGRPRSSAVRLHRHTPALFQPKVAFLGGLFFVTWIELDDYSGTEPMRLMGLTVTGEGIPLGTPEELDLVPGLVPAQFHVRLDDRVLTGYLIPGQTTDGLHFLSWQCGP